MTAAVIGAVLAAAILHASWNALAKTSRDSTVLFGQSGVVSAVAAVPVLYRLMIGTVFLREPVGRLRVVCSMAVAAGITLLAVS